MVATILMIFSRVHSHYMPLSLGGGAGSAPFKYAPANGDVAVFFTDLAKFVEIRSLGRG